jgi:hypothetical protein
VRLSTASPPLRLGVAEELGVSPSLISSWRDGSQVPTEDDLELSRLVVRRTRP